MTLPLLPTVRLARLAALGVPLALLGLVSPAGLPIACVWGGGLLVLATIDTLRTGRPSQLRLGRIVPARAAQGRSFPVRLRLAWNGRGAARLRLRDTGAPALDAPGARLEIAMPPRSRIEVAHEVTPRARGDIALGPVAYRVIGPLGLVERPGSAGDEVRMRIGPDIWDLSPREAALGLPRGLREGVRRGPRHGEGREFHQLRDYTPGDDLRLVDWKAFARRARPAVRETRAERNQRILLLLDGGRLMTVDTGGRQRFDWAAQAAGRLARAALAQGDSVGCAVYGRELRASVPPARHPGQMRRIDGILSTLQPEVDESDLGAALRVLLRGSARRTLVVVFTELADPRVSESVRRHLGLIARRHLGLVVTLSDTALEGVRTAIPDTAVEVWRRVVAEELTQEMLKTEGSLGARGCLVVRARTDALAAETVDRYLSIKRAGLL